MMPFSPRVVNAIRAALNTNHSMPHYNFDSCTDRRHSDAIKYAELSQFFGDTDLLPMWIADMDFDVCPEICEALTRRIDHHIYGYASIPPEFYPTISQWLQRRHNFKVDPEEMTFVPGVVRGIGYAINRLTRPGEKILIQPPVYHPFRHVIEGNNRVVVTNPLRPVADGYEMDLEGLAEVIEREKPVMMILCNPHNPVGIQWSRETLERVAEICARHGVIVISDEIHGDLMLGGISHVPFLEVSDDARKIGIMLGAPSKSFNIPGMVSSWMIIKDPELRRRMFDWLTVNEFNVPTFFATTATIAAYTHGEKWLDEALAYIEKNIDYVAEHIGPMTCGKLKIVKPSASFLVWVDCRDLGMTHEQLKQFIVNKARLALNDGAMFGVEGEGYMRMNLGAPRSIVEKALKQLGDAVTAL